MSTHNCSRNITSCCHQLLLKSIEIIDKHVPDRRTKKDPNHWTQVMAADPE